MSHLPFTILAYLLNGVAVTVDKVMLVRHIPDPLIYIFYFSLVSCLALFLLPFTQILPIPTLTLASISTLLWTSGAYFMFKALQIGQVSRVIPIIGTLIPAILLFQASFSREVNGNEIMAIVILILGLVFLTLDELKGRLNKKEVFYEIVSAAFFAISYILLHEAYKGGDFLSVLVQSRLILIPVGAAILVIPGFRKIVFSDSGPKINFLSKAGALFATGQICAGISELLITFSVSLATPALVNSLQGTQYVFLFVLNLMLARKYPKIFIERLSILSLSAKIMGIILIGFGLYILAFAAEVKSTQNMTTSSLGTTYSPRYAKLLGLDERKTYITMLDELPFKKIRIPVYWDEVEKVEGKYDFSEIDFYIKEAEKRGDSIILVVGYKQPRWPECFAPHWAKRLNLEEKDKRILELVKKEVGYFKKYKNIEAWQVENEPLHNFGICEKVDGRVKERFKKELEVVRALDSRPIIITDSGELSSWLDSFSGADIFGTTVYRFVWSPYFGTFHYPLPPWFYSLKAKVVSFLTNSKPSRLIVSELQAEVWIKDDKNPLGVPAAVQAEDFPAGNILKHTEFAKKIGFSEVYLWGVEWWYFMDNQGYPQYLETAKNL